MENNKPRYTKLVAFIPKQQPRRYLHGIIRGRLHMTTNRAYAMPIPDLPDVVQRVSDALYEMMNTRVEFEPLGTEGSKEFMK